MIEFNDVSKVYTVGDAEVRALDHVSMRINEGEFVAIVGPSGSGKSTMMNIIGCLDTASSGTYLLDGQAIEEYSEAELTRIRSKKIGFIFQSFNLIGTMTAAENVELPLIYQRIDKKERAARVDEALRQVGLAGRAKHKPFELSGGQQQRVAIARAIATRPSLFLADEPTGNLDSHTGREIMELFHAMHAAGNTIVLITHDEMVARQASRSIHIFDGHIVSAEEAAAMAAAAPAPVEGAVSAADVVSVAPMAGAGVGVAGAADAGVASVEGVAGAVSAASVEGVADAGVGVADAEPVATAATDVPVAGATAAAPTAGVAAAAATAAPAAATPATSEATTATLVAAAASAPTPDTTSASSPEPTPHNAKGASEQ